ncbi:hypothetical protein [Parasynechococcus sp.]|jgi:hypothetical protein|uniref:hypothetical protein n=1 Tax=Parasynechococcus sp. TaxID=3101203 RepID=UPI0037042B1C
MTKQRAGDQLERDFDQAKRSGRWLSDDEMQVLADQEQALLVEQQRVLANRRKMIVLTGVCIVLPPLWPLALLLTLVLLYPTTMKRVGVVSGVVFVVLTLVSSLGLLALMIWLFGVLF